MYASYDYYIGGYLLGREAAVPDTEWPFCERQARADIDRYTSGRLKGNPELCTEEVKDCACELAELHYRAWKQQEAADASGLAGPLTSWENDGQRGTVDLSASAMTEEGRREKVRRTVRRHLLPTGLLYQGVNGDG